MTRQQQQQQPQQQAGGGGAAAAAALAALGLYEAVVWTLDPFGVHRMLNDNEPLSQDKALTAAAVNGGTFFVFALAAACHWPWVLAAAVPFLALFTFMQVS